MQKKNYQKELEQLLKQLDMERTKPTLLLHSCCAPCSSYVLEYLSNIFSITVFYYNPNIYPKREYENRIEEQKKFIACYPFSNPVYFIQGNYNPNVFYEKVKGLENEKEGKERCFVCYRLRLEESAIIAAQNKFDYFTTTLTISPLKDAQKLNEIGGQLGETYGVSYLYSDFKKKDGYKRSIQLSNEYGLYRQQYCGCVFSNLEKTIINKTNS